MTPRMHFSSIRTNQSGFLVCDYPSHSRRPDALCPTIDEFILENKDAIWITANSIIGIQLVPTNEGTMTMVEIDDEIAPGIARMRVRHPRDTGGETTLSVGLWNKGEGRRSIRSQVWNAMVQCIDPRDAFQGEKIHTHCPNALHGVEQEKRMRESVDPATDYKTVCLFNIVFEKMCTECLREIAGAELDPDGLAGVNLDA